MDKKIKVHVVTHTHWDREWYLSFEIFRARLLELLDNLPINMEKYRDFKFFSMDGQVVVLEDYFELCPEKKEAILSLIREKKVEVGPWYILPDEFLITGESFIRNFLIAQEILNNLGVEGTEVGYLPDMFGHNAYTPSIIKGLGLKAAILWRGVGDKSRETEFLWIAPNGDEIPVVNLIHSYSNGAHFGKPVNQIKEQFKNEINELSKRSTTPNILIMNGTDHEFPLYELSGYFPEWEKELDEVEIFHSTFANYVNSVLNSSPVLRNVYGELKSPKYEFILKDVTSTRIYLKLANFQAQKIFTHYVEPLAAFLYTLGENYNDQAMKYGWKQILKSHPHDSICGCSTDEVHKDVETRLRSAQEVGIALIGEYMDKISEYVERKKERGIPLLVFNPYEYKRNAYVSSFFPLEKDKVYEVISEEGDICESYINNENILQGSDDLKATSALLQYKKAISPSLIFSSSFKNIVFYAKELPPLGFKVFYLREKTGGSKNFSIQDRTFENSFYKFILNNDGSFDLTDKINRITYKNLNYFEDLGDRGDEYNFSPLLNDKVITSLKKDAYIVDIKDYGFQKVIKVHINISLPSSIAPDRNSRKEEMVITPISITYKLLRDKPRIDIELKLTNTAKDHKLSFVAEIPEVVEKVINDGYFGIVTHPSDFRYYGNDYAEEDISRYAMESFAYVNGKKAKIAIATQGIHEYESHIVNGNTKLNFTLIRAIGWLSRGDLLTRRGDAGPSFETPEAQCLGTYTYKYSFILLEDGVPYEVYRETRDYLLEPVAIKIDKEKDVKNVELPKITFSEGLVLSSFKPSWNNKGVVLRVFNQNKDQASVSIISSKKLKVFESNMRETPLRTIFESSGGNIEIKPYKIETILFVPIEQKEGEDL